MKSMLRTTVVWLTLLLTGHIYGQAMEAIPVIFKSAGSVAYQSEDVIEYYKRNIENIISVDGETIANIPVTVTVDTSKNHAIFGNSVLQFVEVQKGDTLDVELSPMPTRMVTFDFKAKKWYIVDSASDEYVRPKNAEEALKAMYKTIKKQATETGTVEP